MNRFLYMCTVVCVAAMACTCSKRTDRTGENRTVAENRAALDKICALVRQKFPGLPEISAKELMAIKSKPDVVIVDVRADDEQAVSMIPGAISADQFMKNQDRYRDYTIVTHCTVGYRSAAFAKKLLADGFKVRNLKGGITGWTYAGGPLVGPDGKPTNRVHTYDSDWNMVPPGYQPVY